MVFLYLVLLVPQVFVFFYGFNTRLGIGAINEFLQPLLIIFLILISWNQLAKSIHVKDVLFVLSVSLFYFFSFLIYPETQSMIEKNGVEFIFTVLPFFLMGASMDLKEQEHTLVVIGRIGVLLEVFLIYMGLSGSYSFDYSEEDEYMGIAYLLLVPLIFVVWNLINRFNIEDLLLSLAGFFALLGLGTRGPVASLVVFVAVSMLLSIKKLFFRVFIVIIGALIIYFIEPILMLTIPIIQSIGMSSRVIENMLLEEININGRDSIIEQVAFKIKNQDFIGSGLYYDRVLLGDDTYTHNVIYELLLNFGVYIGSFLILILILGLFRSLYKLRGTGFFYLLLAFVCIGFIPLLFSDSYLEYQPFWMLLGVCACVYRTPRTCYLEKQSYNPIRK